MNAFGGGGSVFLRFCRIILVGHLSGTICAPLGRPVPPPPTLSRVCCHPGTRQTFAGRRGTKPTGRDLTPLGYRFDRRAQPDGDEGQVESVGKVSQLG